MTVINKLFGTKPIVIHAHGSVLENRQWPIIKALALSSSPIQNSLPDSDLTVFTCNNGHKSMGLFEQSARRLRVPYVVGGLGVTPWINSRDKPHCVQHLLSEIDSEYVLYSDSRDAVLIGPPGYAVEKLLQNNRCQLLFGADRINWPALPEFREFEAAVSEVEGSDFRFLNGGGWIGRTEFCNQFFAEACETAPLKEAPHSEQGILKQLYKKYYPRVQLDHRCEVFQNIGYVFSDLLSIYPDTITLAETEF